MCNDPANAIAVMKFNKSARRFALLEQDAEDLAGSDVLATSPPQGTTEWIGTMFNKSTRRFNPAPYT